MTTETKQVPVDLLPCPFCGTPPEIRPEGNDLTKKRRIVVRCPSCRVERADASFREGMEWLEGIAVKNWNQRAAPAIEPRYDLLEAANRLCALSADLAHQGDEERAYAAADIAAEVRVHAEATEPSEVERLAVEIADEAAIQSIACECSHHYMDDGVTWADTSYARDNDVDLGPDLRYLDLRGLLEHHPDHHEWVRIKGEKS